MQTEFTDEHRTRALEIMLHKAERDIGLDNGEGYPLRERAHRILQGARRTAIETRYYQLAWFLWKNVPATQH